MLPILLYLSEGKKIPLLVITTGWQNQKCFWFCFTFWRISKKRKEIMKYLWSKKESTEIPNSLQEWHSNFHMNLCLSIPGGLVNSTDPQVPQRVWDWAHKCTLLFCWVFGLMLIQVVSGAYFKETVLWKIYPLKYCLFYPKNVCFVLEAIISWCMDNPHWEESVCIIVPNLLPLMLVLDHASVSFTVFQLAKFW